MAGIRARPRRQVLALADRDVLDLIDHCFDAFACLVDRAGFVGRQVSGIEIGFHDDEFVYVLGAGVGHREGDIACGDGIRGRQNGPLLERHVDSLARRRAAPSRAGTGRRWARRGRSAGARRQCQGGERSEQEHKQTTWTAHVLPPSPGQWGWDRCSPVRCDVQGQRGPSLARSRARSFPEPWRRWSGTFRTATPDSASASPRTRRSRWRAYRFGSRFRACRPPQRSRCRSQSAR